MGMGMTLNGLAMPYPASAGRLAPGEPPRGCLSSPAAALKRTACLPPPHLPGGMLVARPAWPARSAPRSMGGRRRRILAMVASNKQDGNPAGMPMSSIILELSKPVRPAPTVPHTPLGALFIMLRLRAGGTGSPALTMIGPCNVPQAP